MWRPVKVITQPAEEPLDLADVKFHVREDSDERDAILSGYAAAARAYIERVTGTKLVTQTVELRATEWSDLSNLPIAPVQSVEIAYIDAAGDAQDLSEDVYEARLDGLEPEIVLNYGQAWPSRRPGTLITLTAVVGYGEAADQEPDIVHALRLLVGDMNRFSETVEVGSTSRLPVESTVENLLVNHRLHLITS